MKLCVLFLAALMNTLIYVPAYACQTDSQCLAPATCQFAAGQLRGECRDRSTPAVTPGEKGRVAPLAQRKIGDVCQFTVDCGFGMYCYKPPAAAEGKCFPPTK